MGGGLDTRAGSAPAPAPARSRPPPRDAVPVGGQPARQHGDTQPVRDGRADAGEAGAGRRCASGGRRHRAGGSFRRGRARPAGRPPGQRVAPARSRLSSQHSGSAQLARPGALPTRCLISTVSSSLRWKRCHSSWLSPLVTSVRTPGCASAKAASAGVKAWATKSRARPAGSPLRIALRQLGHGLVHQLQDAARIAEQVLALGVAVT